MTLEFSRVQVFRELVFSKDISVDRKSRQSFERILLQEEAQWILAIIWRESKYVSDSDLAVAGLSRLFPGGDLTAFGLAVKLAELTEDCAALNTRIRNIAIAAHAFGLVERSNISATKVSITGTALLHSVMTRLAQEYAAAARMILGADVSG